MADVYGRLIEILSEVKGLVNSPDTDISWSGYDSITDLLSDIDSFIEKARRHDASFTKDLKMLFAPTGPLQEISISSGWGHEFIELSLTIDKLLLQLE